MICNKCERNRILDEMCKSSRNKSGYRPLCKECKRNGNKEKYRSSDEVRVYMQAWRSKHKRKVKLYNQRYSQKEK